MGTLIIDLPTRYLAIDLGRNVPSHRILVLGFREINNAWRKLPAEVAARLRGAGWDEARFIEHFGAALDQDRQAVSVDELVARIRQARKRPRA